MGQGDPGGQHQAGMISASRGCIFHNVSFRECVPMAASGLISGQARGEHCCPFLLPIADMARP
jgi:hypothetical protein